MTFSPQFLDEVRSRTTLSSLIQRDVPLKKAGVEYKACCPFHDEKSPSFYVNDAKGMGYCFGCTKRIDAISWMTDKRGLSFVDAVKELAAAAGLEIPDSDPRQAERDREMTEMREIMARAARWFMGRKPGSDAAMAYLAERGITPLVAQDFDIGFATGGRPPETLRQHLADVATDKLVKLGLLVERPQADGEIQVRDKFRRRIMFPIHDQRGRVIAFGGRILGQGEPKYLNSPDTPLFDKGRTLFNLHRAAAPARKAGRLVVVEGYMDVIAMTRAGVTETVAPNGTAFTEAQMAACWRLADVPIMCLDGDKAGRAAMARAAIKALPLLEPGKSLAFVTPPAGQDPDDLLREQGAEAVQALLEKPRPLVDVLWAHERDAEPADTPEQVAGLKARLRAHVRSIRNADVRQAYGQEIARRFASTFDAEAEGVRSSSGPQIRSRPTERAPFRRVAAPPPASAAQKQIGRAGVGGEIERAVLIGLLLFPTHLRKVGKAVFRHERIAAVVSTLAEQAWMNDLTTEEELADEINRLGLADEIDHLCAGPPLAFAFTRRGAGPAAADGLADMIVAMAR